MFDLNHIHPMIVHFPIALLIVGFVSELIGTILKKEFFRKGGLYLLVTGAIGLIAAYFSGEQAGGGLSESGLLKDALENHEHSAVLSAWVVSIAAVFRIVVEFVKKYRFFLNSVGLILFLAGVISISRTGYYGGELVFKHAAGVQLNLGFDPAESFNSGEIPAPKNESVKGGHDEE